MSTDGLWVHCWHWKREREKAREKNIISDELPVFNSRAEWSCFTVLWEISGICVASIHNKINNKARKLRIVISSFSDLACVSQYFSAVRRLMPCSGAVSGRVQLPVASSQIFKASTDANCLFSTFTSAATPYDVSNFVAVLWDLHVETHPSPSHDPRRQHRLRLVIISIERGWTRAINTSWERKTSWLGAE